MESEEAGTKGVPAQVGVVKTLIRRIVPFGLRVELMRLAAMRRWRAESALFVLVKARAESFPFAVAELRSPLRRPGTTNDEKLQLGKETNVVRAAGLIDGIVVPPGAVFSYHHAVGRPTRRRGFVRGAELQDGSLKPGIGGGCCQVSNLLYALALLSGAQIVDRHRHGLDLFPDSGRTIPFGCGATVFFPSRDLRFRNCLEVDLRIGLSIEDGHLVGRVASQTLQDVRFEIFEFESAIRQEGLQWIRENRVGRRRRQGDEVVSEEEVAHNVARCLYDPTETARSASAL